jgi:tetratricopeptide (TPR) repeat protein
MSPRSRILVLASTLVVALSALAPAARAADPFYLDLLRDGSRALDDGNHDEARRLLRLACFGMLEEPKLLADCLTRLALAEAGLADREGFVSTYDRIAELERRFQAYSQAETPDPLRQAFADRAVQWVPARDLAAVTSLAEALDRKLRAEIAALPPAQRRARLDELAQERPEDPTWPAMRAELELAEGDPAAARAAAEAVLASDPDDQRAACILGRALATLGQCEQALSSLGRCAAPELDPDATVAKATCMAALERWDEAAAALASLPPQTRQSSAVRSLENRVGKQQARAAAQAEKEAQRSAAEQARLQKEAERQARIEARTAGRQSPPEERAAVREEPPAAGDPLLAVQSAVVEPRTAGEDRSPAAEPPEPSTAAPASAPTEPERVDLARALDLAARATVAADLEAPMRLARPIADRHPGDAEAQFVVAEIAYRASDWQTAIEYFERGGDPGADRPILLFYQSVSLFEGGRPDRAAETLRRCLPNLKRDPWIDSYVEKILDGPNRGR